MKLSEVALGLRLLARLTESTMTMNHVIEVFPDVAPALWQRPALELRSAVLKGQPLSAALTECIPGFPLHVAAIIKAGESGLGLSSALSRAASAAEQSSARQKAVRQSLTYPAFLVVSSCVTLTILVVVVLPRFSSLLSELQQTLSPAAQMLISASAIMPALLTILGFATAVGAGIVTVMRQSSEGRAVIDRLILALPVIGPFVRDSSVASISSVLSALLTSGIPVAEAIQICEGLANNEHTNRSLVRVRRDILRGSSLSNSLSSNAMLDSAFAGLLRAGEESGTVPQSLEHISLLLRDDLDGRMRRVLATIEPGTVLLMGGLIATVAGVLMQTIYSIDP